MTDIERKKAEQRFFDGVYRELADTPLTGFYAISAGIERYKRLMAEQARSMDVLEYGCGTAAYAPLLLQSGARTVTAIDISPEAIRHAQERIAPEWRDRFHAEVGDAEALAFPDARFDLVCGTGILHHLDLARALPEIRRVLRPGGNAVFYEPLGHNPVLRLYRVLTPGSHTSDEHPLVLSDFEAMRGLFEKVEVEYFDLLSLPAIPLLGTAAGRSIFFGLEALDQRFFRLFLFIRRWASFAIVRLSNG